MSDALVVDLLAEEFPGVSFHEPVPDWRGFKTLLIDVENPDADAARSRRARPRSAASPRRSTIASTGDSISRPWQRRTLRIPLDDIRHGPRDRLMDMAHISDITLFRGASKGSRKLRIYSLRLE